MNKEELYSEIGNIDSKYIQEADYTLKSKFSRWKHYTAIAAVLILAVSVINNYDDVQAKEYSHLFPGLPSLKRKKVMFFIQWTENLRHSPTAK